MSRNDDYTTFNLLDYLYKQKYSKLIGDKQMQMLLNNKCKNIFACLISAHNTISLSRHEKVCLIRLRLERYFSDYRALNKLILINKLVL